MVQNGSTVKFTSQSAAVTDRKKATFTGVLHVDGASDGEISLSTCMGRLIITGSELKLSKFDEADGSLSLTGNIDGLRYAAAKQSLFKRIFK